MDIRLKAGQTLRCALHAGSQLVVLEGIATVHAAPAWMADTPLPPPPARLQDGDTYLGGDGGCVVVTAIASCRVLVLAPAGPWPRLLHWAAALAAKLRGRPGRLQASA